MPGRAGGSSCSTCSPSRAAAPRGPSAARSSPRAPRARALGLVKRLPPRVVLSVGGYASGPVSLAAALRGVPSTVIEPNSVVGPRQPPPRAIRQARVRRVGGGRRAFRAAARRVLRRAAARRASCRVRTRRAARGACSSWAAARAPRRSTSACPRRSRGLGAVAGLEVVHQAGRDRDAAVRAAYARDGLATVTVSPFLDDVARRHRRRRSRRRALRRLHARRDHRGRSRRRSSSRSPTPPTITRRSNAESLAERRRRRVPAPGAGRPGPPRRARSRACSPTTPPASPWPTPRAPGASPLRAADVAADLLDLAGIPRRPRGATNGTGRGHSLPSQEATRCSAGASVTCTSSASAASA